MVGRALDQAIFGHYDRTPEPCIQRRPTKVEVGDRVLIESEKVGSVPSELRTSVFDRFRRGDTAPGYSPGLGIGLSLVLRLAELHGGTARVKDRPGGASFQVTLPVLPH